MVVVHLNHKSFAQSLQQTLPPSIHNYQHITPSTVTTNHHHARRFFRYHHRCFGFECVGITTITAISTSSPRGVWSARGRLRLRKPKRPGQTLQWATRTRPRSLKTAIELCHVVLRYVQGNVGGHRCTADLGQQLERGKPPGVAFLGVPSGMGLRFHMVRLGLQYWLLDLLACCWVAIAVSSIGSNCFGMDCLKRPWAHEISDDCPRRKNKEYHRYCKGFGEWSDS